MDLDSVADRVSWNRVDPIPGEVVAPPPGGPRSPWSPAASSSCPALRRRTSRPPSPSFAGDDCRRPAGPGRAQPRRRPRGRRPAPAVRGGSTRAHGTAPWSSTTPPPAAPRPAQVMMNSTAALQVNLQAGPERGWPERVARAYRLGPTLVAISASSPWLRGRDTGWKSARQRAWGGLDARTCGPVPGCVAVEPGTDGRPRPGVGLGALRPARPGGLRPDRRRRRRGRPDRRSRSSSGRAARSAWAGGCRPPPISTST